MPFSEPTKLKAKRKAHFCCVVCHQPFVEVHHIIPQADDGTDDLDNAAPLCALCHDHFGGNPDKRKQIREMRDLWYELCETRFRDSPTLELAEAIEDVKGSQQEQAALLSSIKRLLENFYTHQSEKVSTAFTAEQISSLTGVTIPPDFSALRKELETERIKRLELEVKVTPRRLTKEQKTALSNSLKKAPSAVIIVSVCQMRKARILRTIWIQLYARPIGKHQGLEIVLMVLAFDMVFFSEHLTEQSLATEQTLRLVRDSTTHLLQSE